MEMKGEWKTLLQGQGLGSCQYLGMSYFNGTQQKKSNLRKMSDPTAAEDFEDVFGKLFHVMFPEQ